MEKVESRANGMPEASASGNSYYQENKTANFLKTSYKLSQLLISKLFIKKSYMIQDLICKSTTEYGLYHYLVSIRFSPSTTE